MIFLLAVLVILSFVCTKSPHLFGNGCIIADDQLIMAGFKQLETEEPYDAYYIEVGPKLVSVDKVGLEWKPYERKPIFPGVIFKVNATETYDLFYFINGRSPTTFLGAPMNKDEENLLDILNLSSQPSSDNSQFNQSGSVSPDSLNFVNTHDRSLDDFIKHLKNDVHIAVYYNQLAYLIDDLNSLNYYGKPLNFITIKDKKDSNKLIETTGDIPLRKKGFSATIHGNKLFLTGGEPNDTNTDTNSIYILDLDTYRWDRKNVPGFEGARSGCLAYSDKYLIHAFGIKSSAYLDTTQFVDTETWSLDPKKPSKEVSKPIENNWSTPAIIGLSGGGAIVIIIIVILVVYFFIPRRKKSSPASPPEFIFRMVWAELQLFDFVMDTSLVTEYETIYFNADHHNNSIKDLY